MGLKKKKNALPKQKKVATLKVGTRKKTTIFLWVLLIFSVAFGIYKNFTAVDTYTVVEKEIIEKKVVDTNKIENFVRNFAGVYYAWENTNESIEKRTEKLKSYMTEELQALNVDSVSADIPNSSSVKSFNIWDIEQLDDNSFKVLFSVSQLISEVTTTTVQETVIENILNEETGEQVPVETKVDKEQKDTKESTVHSAYTMIVYIDDSGNMVVTHNPTVSNLPDKSDYEPVQVQSDGTVDASVQEEIEAFLNTFFVMYPTANEKELVYYVKDNALEPIGREYVFSGLVSTIYTSHENQVVVNVVVSYLDMETNATQLSQFELVLEKAENWVIVKAIP